MLDERLARRNRRSEEERARRGTGGSAGAAAEEAPRRAWLTGLERDAIEQSEGGGRGRRTFLKERNKLPLNVRYGAMPRTLNQSYGWALLNNDERDELVDYCRAVQGQQRGTDAVPPSDVTRSAGLPAIRATRPRFVSEFVSADVARRSQIPNEFASMSARPNDSVPFALSVIDAPASGSSKSAAAGNAAAVAADHPASGNLADASAQWFRSQSDSHRHARGDFRKRTFHTGTLRARGVFPSTEFV